MLTLADYTAACNYPGALDERAVENALRAYLTALGIDRRIVRVRRGWHISDLPDLRTYCAAAARATRDALDARDVRDARAALDARAAFDARAARDAEHHFARWVVSAYGYWYAWDMSWLAATAFGARQLNKGPVSAWAEPILAAYCAGCWRLMWTDTTLYWVAKSTLLRDDRRRLHCETGPALLADDIDAYFWHGTLIPDAWIKDRASLTASVALSWPNIEQRRAACEMLGWHKILAELDATTIDTHADPQIGSLVEVTIPDIGRERFLRVMCGTGREFALPVPPNLRTAIEAQAWTWGLDPKEFQTPEVRT